MKYSGNKLVLGLSVVIWGLIAVFGIGQIRIARANSLTAQACAVCDSLSKALSYGKRALSLDDRNPLFWANLGWMYASSADSLTMSWQKVSEREEYGKNLDSALFCYGKAVKYSDKESIFCLNKSILLNLKGEITDAISILTPLALKQDADASVIAYYGMLQEMNGKDMSAYEEYSKALLRNPSIADSKFFQELFSRNPAMADSVLSNVFANIRKQYEDTEDPLIAAKLGFLSMKRQLFDEAEKYFSFSLSAMPSLNRPWMYLGEIAESKGDTVTAKAYYVKAENLDQKDLLPKLHLLEYDPEYKGKVEMLNNFAYSEHALSLFSHYRCKSVPDPFVMKDFENYFKTDSIFRR